MKLPSLMILYGGSGMSRDTDPNSPVAWGDAPYGDRFGPEQVRAWVEREREAYSAIAPAGPYRYHALNRRHGFRHLPLRNDSRALAFGSRDGEELRPLAACIGELTLLDSSQEVLSDLTLFHNKVFRNTVNWEGNLPFEAESFDLITCFGVLHHIPNVTHLLRELLRVMAPGGFLLLREPIVSMGDWRLPRPGLTQQERGLPLEWLDRSLAEAGYRVRRRTCCNFLPLAWVGDKLGVPVYAHSCWTSLDEALCRLFSRPGPYHRTRPWHHLAPTSVFFVLEKAVQSETAGYA